MTMRRDVEQQSREATEREQKVQARKQRRANPESGAQNRERNEGLSKTSKRRVSPKYKPN
jgi:hypothetical protein